MRVSDWSSDVCSSDLTIFDLPSLNNKEKMMAKRIVLAGCMALALPSTATAADKSVGVLPHPKTTENVLGPVPLAPSFADWAAFSQGLKDMWQRLYATVAQRLTPGRAP